MQSAGARAADVQTVVTATVCQGRCARHGWEGSAPNAAVSKDARNAQSLSGVLSSARVLVSSVSWSGGREGAGSLVAARAPSLIGFDEAHCEAAGPSPRAALVSSQVAAGPSVEKVLLGPLLMEGGEGGRRGSCLVASKPV